MKAPSRKTPLANEFARNKIGEEFVFRLTEDLVQGSTNRFDAELLFDVDDAHQTRETLASADEPCIVQVSDYGKHSFMGWRGQYGRAKWRIVEVTEEGETTYKPVGEILSLQKIGPNFSATLPAIMGRGATVTVTSTIAGETRSDIDVTDRLNYIPTGSHLPKGATIRYFWNYDEGQMELLDSPTCPVTA